MGWRPVRREPQNSNKQTRSELGTEWKAKRSVTHDQADHAEGGTMKVSWYQNQIREVIISHSTGGLDLTLPLTTHEPAYLQSHIFFYLYQILCNCKFSSSNDNSHWRLFLDTLELESPTSKTHSKILIDNPGSLLPVHSRLHRVTELLVTQELPEPAGVLFVFLR